MIRAETTVRQIATFNAELYPEYCNPFDGFGTVCSPYEYRAGYVADAVKSSLVDTDVVCLQGIYYDVDVNTIVQGTEQLFPYSFSFNHDTMTGSYEESTHPPCSDDDRDGVEQVAACEDQKCHSETDRNDYIACMEESCKVNPTKSITDVFLELSETCITCIVLGTKRNAMDCLKQKYAVNPTGLLLLSKHNITHYEREEFPHKHEIVRHGFLHVKIEYIGNVVCTVMQPNLGDKYIDITETTHSYEEKNLEEAKCLTQKTSESKNAIIAGCLNTSPILTKGKVASQFPYSIDVFKMAEFRDPISESYSGEYASCTYCFSDDYVKERYELEGYDGYIFDHVLVKGYHVVSEKTFHSEGSSKINLRVIMHEPGDAFKAISAHFCVRVYIEVEDEDWKSNV
ncbi:uncharacterized protein LOC127733664 [Mytilus californianus]|uniref:uncharacterized protein LOC127733664 n=1 Tax=Mytilus californianus TaxID=6549 RepID=UPI0022471F50|nr:uncharacterized protein LOC127733664 [Mytilus californianus]